MSAAPGQDYGDVTAQLNQQRIAPMAGTAPLPPAATPGPPGPPGGGAPPSMPAYQGGAFNAPTARPNEPVTAGAAIGPGPGPEALSFQPVQQGQGTGAMTALLQRMSATDTTGILGQLMTAAQSHGA